ncbi:hypothetical protein [Methanothermobacter thermautotrophicus]|uniref:hypothetical protein n=1 Tax=Methanothermobacter thermautotrophicus TaxID=145262 RepID=UPI0022B9812A|nr:hypothetical protein [Methanothermobacter thermautotrophicus]WBF08932.1 hypothetical protein ISG36_04435 [Methanothermobacter thermautotrophicus]
MSHAVHEPGPSLKGQGEALRCHEELSIRTIPDGGSTPTAPSNPGQPQAPGTSADKGEPHHEESQGSDVSTSAPGVEAATHSSAGENQGKAYEVSSASGSANPETGLPVYAIVGIVAIVGLLGLGYFFGPGRTD